MLYVYLMALSGVNGLLDTIHSGRQDISVLISFTLLEVVVRDGTTESVEETIRKITMKP